MGCPLIRKQDGSAVPWKSWGAAPLVLWSARLPAAGFGQKGRWAFLLRVWQHWQIRFLLTGCCFAFAVGLVFPPPSIPPVGRRKGVLGRSLQLGCGWVWLWVAAASGKRQSQQQSQQTKNGGVFHRCTSVRIGFGSCFAFIVAQDSQSRQRKRETVNNQFIFVIMWAAFSFYKRGVRCGRI